MEAYRHQKSEISRKGRRSKRGADLNRSGAWQRHGNVTMLALLDGGCDPKLPPVFGDSGDLSKADWGYISPSLSGDRDGERVPNKLGSLRETEASLIVRTMTR